MLLLPIFLNNLRLLWIIVSLQIVKNLGKPEKPPDDYIPLIYNITLKSRTSENMRGSITITE